ncbi:MAG: 50S ribosomal protein L18 [Nanoarchaeota archaeon]
MAINKKYTVPYKRKKLGLTNYKVRLRLISSKKTRLIIRKSLNNFIVQLADYNPKGDKIIKSFNCSILRTYGWRYCLGNLPSAYLLGLIVGFEAKKLKIKEAILDIGLNQSVKGSSIYTLLKGALDAGLIIPHNKEILPTEERINGKHISDYYNLLLEDKKHKQFSKYLKNNVNPANMMKDFQEVKIKILNKYKNG